MSQLILNVEADELLYRAAFATEKQAYKLTTKNGSIRDFGNRYTKSQILAKLKLINLKDYELEGYKIAEDQKHTLFILKRNLMKLKQIGELRLWLSPSDGSNFRFDVAKTPGPRGLGYKAGRPEKPVHYQVARDYLKNHWGAEEIHGYEADDALGMFQNDNTVAVHIDKDINMIYGKHLNWLTNERYVVEPGLGTLPKEGVRGTGMAFFWHQMLTGDNVDNIPGIPNIGPVKATKHLEGCKTEKEMFDKVRELYYTIYKDDAFIKMKEIANLLYIVNNKLTRGEEYICFVNSEVKE